MRHLPFLLAVMIAAVGGMAADSPAKAKRSLTLDQCIRLALEHNLDLQVQRYNPQIALFDLQSSYGAYDPMFSATAQHSYTAQPPGFDPQFGIFPGSESESDRLSGGLSGLLPWGMNYSLGANLNDQNGLTTEFTVVTNVIGTNVTTILIPFQNTQGSMGAFQLSQPLLKNFWIDGPRLQIALNKRNLEISEHALQFQVMAVLAAVEAAYYNVVFAFEQVEVQKQAVGLADRTLLENKKRVEVGAMAPLDEKQAEAGLAGRRADLLRAQADLATAQNLLKDLLTDDYSGWYRFDIEPVDKLVALPVALDIYESWTRGMAHRPDLIQARINVDRQGVVVSYQKNQLWPQLDVVGSVGYNASTRDDGLESAVDQWANRDAPFYSFGAQVNIPLGNRAARNNLRAAKASKEQLQLQLKRLEQSAMVEIDNAITLVRSSLERVSATREARLYSEAALDAEQKKLENGKSTSFVVLQLQNDLTSARSQEIRALADYNIALSQLSFREGSTLERNHIYWNSR